MNGFGFNIELLKARVRIHNMSAAGMSAEDIGARIGMSDRSVARYLRRVKPILAARISAAEWNVDAACRGKDSELFFPSTNGIRAARMKEQAIEICHTCPVIDRCRETAISNYETYGIWAGEDFSKYSYEFDESTGTIKAKGSDGSVTKVS